MNKNNAGSPARHIQTIIKIPIQRLLNYADESQGISQRQIVTVIASVCLLFIAIAVYCHRKHQHKTIQFTEFNSQYVGKESTRSDSQRDFPNFAVDVLKETNDAEESVDGKAQERRRRRRKTNRLQRKEEGEGHLDLSPPIVVGE